MSRHAHPEDDPRSTDDEPDDDPWHPDPRNDPARAQHDRKGGGCFTVLGLWALVPAALVLGAVVWAVIGTTRPAPIVTPVEPLERSFPCEKGGCAARMEGPHRWHRAVVPAVSASDLALALESEDVDGALFVTMTPLQHEIVPDEAANGFLRAKVPNRRLEEVARRDVEIGGERGTAVHARILQGSSVIEGYVGFAIRNDRLFVVTAAVAQGSFAAMEQELLGALRDFQLPAVERIDAKPSPAVVLPEPAPPPGPTSPEPAGLLMARASEVVARDPRTAAALQRAAVDKGALAGEYDLACFEALAGHTDAAFYWLQKAAGDDGVNADWAEEDGDLAALRADQRWPAVRAYLRRMVRFWAATTAEQQVVTAPKSAPPAGGRPVVIGLHGLGSRPEDFSGPRVQSAADSAGVAFVSLSATRAGGPHVFMWSEDPALDRARLDRGLAAVAGAVVPAPGKLITLGFSQGAQMAVEIAARDPGRFAGAIVMSPGTRLDLGLDDLPRSVSLVGRRFVLVAGAGEHPSTVARAQSDADRLRARGAEVYHHAYPGMDRHSFPPDFEAALPRWIAFILDGKPL